MAPPGLGNLCQVLHSGRSPFLTGSSVSVTPSTGTWPVYFLFSLGRRLLHGRLLACPSRSFPRLQCWDTTPAFFPGWECFPGSCFLPGPVFPSSSLALRWARTCKNLAGSCSWPCVTGSGAMHGTMLITPVTTHTGTRPFRIRPLTDLTFGSFYAGLVCAINSVLSFSNLTSHAYSSLISFIGTVRYPYVASAIDFPCYFNYVTLLFPLLPRSRRPLWIDRTTDPACWYTSLVRPPTWPTDVLLCPL